MECPPVGRERPEEAEAAGLCLEEPGTGAWSSGGVRRESDLPLSLGREGEDGPKRGGRCGSLTIQRRVSAREGLSGEPSPEKDVEEEQSGRRLHAGADMAVTLGQR